MFMHINDCLNVESVKYDVGKIQIKTLYEKKIEK